MEINTLILERAIKESFDASSNQDLDRIIVDAQRFSTLEIFDGKSLNQFERSLHEISNRLYAQFHATQDVGLISSFVASQIKILNSSITKNNLNDFVIFNVTRSYIKTPLVKAIEVLQFEQEVIDQILVTIQNFVKSFTFDLFEKPGAPSYEKQMLISYREAASKYEAKGAYELVSSIERGSGFRFSYIASLLIESLYELDLDKYLDALSKRTRPHEIVMFYDSAPHMNESIIASASDRLNVWASFELIRRIVRRNAKVPSTEASISAIRLCLRHLRLSRFHLFLESIPFYMSSAIFNESLGDEMAELSLDDLKVVIDSSILVDKSNAHLDERSLLLDRFLEKANAEHKDVFLKETFFKWDKYLMNLKEEDQSLKQIVLTDYANFVINYYLNFKTGDQVLSEIESITTSLIHIYSHWFKSSSHQTATFFVALSRLYILGFVCKNAQIELGKQRLVMSDIFSDNLIKARFMDDLPREQFEVISDNFGLDKKIED